MLSAFTARPIVELPQRNKSKIESVLAYGDRILVGLNTGSLRVYRVNEEADGGVTESSPDTKPKTKAADLLQEHEKFSKYKIEQLAIIKEANLLVALCNSYVSTYDLQTFQLQEMLAKTKGATTFAVTSDIVKDSTTDIPSIVSRLAVAVKRRLLLWSWHDSELSSETTELTLVTGIKTLTWATGTKLVAGLNSSFVMIQVETSEVTDIVGPGSIGGAPGQDGGRLGAVGVAGIGYMGMGGSAPKPLCTRLSEGQLLLAKDINTLFIDTDGNSLGKRQVPWAVAPEAVGYSYPFLLALQSSKGALEVRNPETLNSLQTISMPNANQLHVAQPNVRLAHAGRGFLISSDRSIWRMQALGYDAQIDVLVERNRFDEAISLMTMLEAALIMDKEGKLREVKMLKAQGLFDHGKYRASLDLFNEVEAPPERVIRLYPDVITGDISTIEQGEEPSGDSDEAAQDGSSADVSRQSTDLSKASASMSDAASSKIGKASGGTGGSDTASFFSRFLPTGESTQSLASDGKDLKVATSELAAFLVGARTRLQRYLNPDGSMKNDEDDQNTRDEGHAVGVHKLLVRSQSADEDKQHRELLATAKLVDTTLFRAYMYAQPSMAVHLFRLPNFCDSDVVKEKLSDTGRYNDLINFFFGKRLHEQALDLLAKSGKGKDDGKEELRPLRGPQRTVGYLQNLPPEMLEIILKYVKWPLKADSDVGMQVFLADTENAETLPRDRVLEFLQGIDMKLAIRYLKHVIFELNDETPDFHHRLIGVYLEGLKTRHFESDAERLAWRDDLIEFLKTSHHYESWKVIKQLGRDDPDLYEARAVVLGNMGEHRQALDIYVFKLGDPQKAEEYCNQIYLTESSQTASQTKSRRPSVAITDDRPPTIYHALLALYLSPPPPHKPQWEPALEILAKHGSRLPASSTLDLIPEVLPIRDLESYFRGRIRSANTIVNEARVVNGLMKTTDDNLEAMLRLGDGAAGGKGGRNRKVIVSEDRLCGVCHKRFGASAIKIMPNNAVIHYACSAR